MRLSWDGCLPLLTLEAVQFHRDFISSLGLTPLTLLGIVAKRTSYEKF